MTTNSLQTLIAATLGTYPDLVADGLSPALVFPADTLDNPKTKPFVVVRWLDVAAGLAAVKRRPLMLWWYDDQGDFTRAKRMARNGRDALCALDPSELDDGWLLQFEDREMGPESTDSGWQALVIPYNMVAIASAT